MITFIYLLIGYGAGTIFGAIVGWTERDKRARQFEAQVGAWIMRIYEDVGVVKSYNLRRVK